MFNLKYLALPSNVAQVLLGIYDKLTGEDFFYALADDKIPVPAIFETGC